MALVLLLSAPAGAADAGAASPDTAPATGVPEAPPNWMLEEFDWGDDEEVVAESIQFDPHFACTGDKLNPCTLVSAVVDREKLLARFTHHEGELWQVIFLTPDIASGNPHLRRVWQLLADYVTKMKGKPEISVGFPDLAALAYGPPHLTHFWSLPGLEARVMVGRRDVDLYYVGLFFSDPVRGKVARDAWLSRVAASDERGRKKRAAKAAKVGKPRAGE
jgi:hypothetical protein